MRLFLLPISTKRALIYCQRIAQKPTSHPSLVDKIIKRAGDTWVKWEAAEKGWREKVTEYGNQALKRIPYQEWGLKSFPPLNQTVQAEELAANRKFPVFYPENIIAPDDVPKIIRRLASERKQLHWQRFLWSAIGLPITAPFALVPVIPNIPFFYMAFRCWSHWRALRGSDHLDFIIDHRLFKPVSSTEMETIYLKSAPKLQNSFVFVTRSQVLEGDDPEEHMLLNESSHKDVAQELGVPELGAEIDRAVWQVKTSLERQKAAQRSTAATGGDKQGSA